MTDASVRRIGMQIVETIMSPQAIEVKDGEPFSVTLGVATRPIKPSRILWTPRDGKGSARFELTQVEVDGEPQLAMPISCASIVETEEQIEDDDGNVTPMMVPGAPFPGPTATASIVFHARKVDGIGEPDAFAVAIRGFSRKG